MNVDAAVAAEPEWMVALLERLVAAPTTLGHEEQGQAVMRDAFAAYVAVDAPEAVIERLADLVADVVGSAADIEGGVERADRPPLLAEMPGSGRSSPNPRCTAVACALSASSTWPRNSSRTTKYR